MRGLKTQETNEFIRFFERVQETAKKQKAIFFLSGGEGREFSFREIEGEDLSGWLIPETSADSFEAVWKKRENGKELDPWADFFRFAIWEKEKDCISVAFKNFG